MLIQRAANMKWYRFCLTGTSLSRRNASLEYKLALAADIQGVFGMIKYLYGLDSHEKQETSMAKRLILEKI